MRGDRDELDAASETMMHEDAAAAVAGGYQYEIAQCDVVDKEKLERYRVKRSGWLHLLDGDQEHAVWKQIAVMLWNDAVFRVINESRGLASDRGYQSAARNGMPASLIDQGYVAIQALAIRKLMEKGSSDPKFQVVSLQRLLDEIKSNRDIITREIYVAYDGRLYDPEPGRGRFYPASWEPVPGERVAFVSLPTSGPEAWRSAERAHAGFDELSGVAPLYRSRDDLISEETFERLQLKLASSKWREFVHLSNKFIAHAADLSSRASSDAERGLTLKQITRCHQALPSS